MVHVVSALGWLGIDVVLLVFAVTGLASDDPAVVAVCYQAMELFVIPTVVPAALLSLGSGILLGLGSRYGLLRYWWVAVKLALNIVLLVLVVVLLRPGLDNAAEAGRQVGAGIEPEDFGTLQADSLFPPGVSIAALLFATVLAVYKPWGRLRRDTA